MRTILLSCLLLALLSNYTPYAQDGISPPLPDEPAPEGDAAAAAGSNSGTENLAATEDLATKAAEAPEALFELNIGDAEVDFFLEGTWRASVFGSFGLLFGPDGTQLSPFPGLDTGQVFQQMPDLTFSVWLLNRFFIEASVIGDFLEKDYNYFDQNYILMGYLGAEEEFLKRVLIGSKDVSIDPFPFIDVPEPGSSSLGVEAVMGTRMSEHQLLLRYDNNEPDSLTYIGSNLVSEQVIALDEYIQGRFFKLPDSGLDPGTLVVYLEDPKGSFPDLDGRKYRKATVNDAELNSENGTVFLKAAAEGWVVVYYEKGGAAVGDGTLGGGALAGTSLAEDKIDLSRPDEDFEFDVGKIYLGQNLDERQVIIGSDTCLRLYRPGEFSPFEVLAGYALEEPIPDDLSRLRVAIVRKGNLNTKISTAAAEVAFRLIPGKDFVQAFYQPAPGLRDDFRNLYPFLDATNPDPPFDPENLIYGPLADAKPGYLNYEVLVSELTPVSAYQIGSDIVPGSVQILRNGITETRFEVDYETGLITFLTEIAPDDRLVVSFRRQSALANNGDILFAWGNTLTFSEALELQLATGVRWNFLPGSYTEEAYSRTGTVVASAGAAGTIGPLSYNATIGGAYTNPDTTGVMRLLSMESTGLEIPLSESTAYPSATPSEDVTTIPDALPANTADSNGRGKLLYKDFRDYGLLGTSTLLPWDAAGPPSGQDYQYVTGSKPGPYMVGEGTNDPTDGSNLVMDFELDSGDWVGMQLPVTVEQGVRDLSSFEGITLLYNVVDFNDTGNFTIYLQIGEIGEDLDGDGPPIDEELSENSAGFNFDDTANGAVLRVGSGPKNTGNGRLDSEDIDGNGFLDGDGDAAESIVTVADPGGAISGASASWARFDHSFTAMERSRLRRSRSIRILVVENGAGPVSASILFDRITLVGNSFYVDDSAAGYLSADDVEVREIDERELLLKEDDRVEGRFDTVEEVFHPFGETQKVLEIEWKNGTGSEAWLVRGYTEAQTEGIRYRNVVYYYKDLFGDGALFSFDLEDTEGRGIHWSYAPFSTVPALPETNAWEEIRVSLDERKVYKNGEAIAGATVTVDSTYESLALFTVELSNATSGTLYLDELHLTDPAGAFGAAAELELELNLPGELISWGAHPLIHDLSFRQRAAYASRGFSTLYGTPLAMQSYSSVSELDLGLSLVDVSVDFTVAGTDTLVTLAGGHGIKVPNIPFPVVFSDSFSLRERDTGTELQRENTLILKAPPLVQLDLQSQAGSLEETLSQSWDADLRITPAPFSLQNSLSISGAVDEFVLGSDGYFPNWIFGYSLLFPYKMLSGWDTEKWPSKPELERQAELDLDWVLATMPAGLQTVWRHGFHSYDFATADRMLRSSGDMELSVPVRWQDRGVSMFSITSGYRRHLDVVDPETGAGDYSDDFSRSFQRIYSQHYFYGQFPYVELYSSEAERLFIEGSSSTDPAGNLDEATYSAEAYAKIARPFSSRIRDLFLPSIFELSLKKQFIKDGDLVDLYNTYTLTSQSTALNLFGYLGAYPLFPFYRTDEFTTSLSLSVDVGTYTGGASLTEWEQERRSGVAEAVEMNLDHFLSFEGRSDENLTFENRLNLRQDRDEIGTEILWGDTIKFLYLWSRSPEAGLRLPLLPEKLGRQGYWSHQESLVLELTGPGEQSSYHPFNLIVSHESAAILPDYGEISGEISAGFDVEKTEGGDRYWRLGFRGGISVQIEF